MLRPRLAILLAVLAVAATGCGGGAGPYAAPATAPSSASSTDARSAATGDIPDNQVFLTYASATGGYVIRYPEGWTRQGSATNVRFVDKDNAIHVRVAAGAPPTARTAGAELMRLRSSQPTLTVRSRPQTAPLPHGRALKLGYSVVGPANPVTGRRPLLLVDRYLYAHGGKVATVDLATPKGVDNVDAYRLISRSFAWR